MYSVFEKTKSLSRSYKNMYNKTRDNIYGMKDGIQT